MSNLFRDGEPASFSTNRPIYPKSFPALLPINGYKYAKKVDGQRWNINADTQLGVEESCLRFFSLLDIVQIMYRRGYSLDEFNKSWCRIPEEKKFGNVDGLEDYINKVLLVAIEQKANDQSVPTPLMVQAWLHGGGVMRTTKTPKPGAEIEALAVIRVEVSVNTVSSLESWLNHRVFNCRSASPSRYLLTLPGEFMINHRPKGVLVSTTGLNQDSGYTLTLGPSLSGRHAKYGLVMGVAQAAGDIGSTFPFVTSRHWQEGRRDEAGAFPMDVWHVDGGLIEDASFQKCLLMFTLWRKVERVSGESASVASPDVPVVQRRSRSTAPQVPAVTVRRSPDRVVPADAVLDSMQVVVYQFSSTQGIAQQFADELTSVASTQPSSFDLRCTVLALPDTTVPPPASTQSYSFSILLHRWTTRVELNEVYQQLVWVKAAHPEAHPLLVSMNREGKPFPLRVTELHTGDVSEKIQQLVGRVYDVGFSQGSLAANSTDVARTLVQRMWREEGDAISNRAHSS